jgi:uncharacterized membrane protein
MKEGKNTNTIGQRAPPKPSSKRFFEIDMMRGLAIILMIFGHILWDLDYFGIMPINNVVYSFLQKTVPPLFFLLIGVSLIVSEKKMESRGMKNEQRYYLDIVSRGLKIFNLGMILTVGSLIFIPGKPVFFGVLHCIGLSVILSAVFLKFRKYNLLIALILIFLGTIIAQQSIENPTSFQLLIGLHPADIWSHTVDYFPLLPWFGICLLGIVIGDWLYSGEERRFRMPDLSKYAPVRMVQWFGKHSLTIYLLHQPVIAGVLFAFFLI